MGQEAEFYLAQIVQLLSTQNAVDVHRRLCRIEELLQRVVTQDKNIMAQIDDLIADAQDESTVDDSIIALLNTVSAQLAAAGTDPAKLAQLKTLIDGNKAKIAAAVTANTPAAPPADTTGGTASA